LSPVAETDVDEEIQPCKRKQLDPKHIQQNIKRKVYPATETHREKHTGRTHMYAGAVHNCVLTDYLLFTQIQIINIFIRTVSVFYQVHI
jgi:hypothetical protein